MTLCADIDVWMSEGRTCVLAGDVARVPTDVVYPSFDQVWVEVKAVPGGFRVSDSGGAVASAIIHGRDDGVIENALKVAAARYGVEAQGGDIAVIIPSLDWVKSALMGVANASAHAANAAVDHAQRAKEALLHEKIYAQLAKVVSETKIKRAFDYRGESGRPWKAEYAIIGLHGPLLIRGVVPHHTSIVHAYAGFGDLPRGGTTKALVVHDQPLEADDSALLRQVADVVTLAGADRAAASLLN